jgi:hypothetical protein
MRQTAIARIALCAFCIASVPLPAFAASRNLVVDGSISSSTPAADIIVLYGWAENSLGNGTNQPPVTLKLQNKVVDGYQFCTGAVYFAPPVPYRFLDEDHWQHGGPPLKNWAWLAAIGGAGNNTYPAFTVRNRSGGDMAWLARVYSGYYKLKTGGSDAEAKVACGHEVAKNATKPQSIP